MELHNQGQMYNGKKYNVSQIVHLSERYPIETVDLRYISKYYELLSGEWDLHVVAETIERVLKADLSKPIIIYRGFVLDGKHRITKSILEKKETIKARFIDELPPSVD